MPDKIYSAKDIARYFLAKSDETIGDLISNLKLQKLCYYAQGLTLATRGTPLFREPIEAWMHGPVVPELYHEFKDNGSGAIPRVTDLDIDTYEPADRKVLDDVYSFFGQYSAWRLREMTHEESPWVDAMAAGASSELSNASMMDFFSTQVSDEYREEYVRLQGVEG